MTHTHKLISGPALIAAGLVIAILSSPQAAEANRAKILYSFAGGPDGANPLGDLITFNGILYGATSRGGGNGDGTIYKIADGQVSVLYAFRGGSDGSGPSGGLLADGEGNVYGTTREGGESNCIFGCGTVFKIAPDGTKSLLYSFTGGSDGWRPSSDLVADGQGNLYGTAHYGGDDRNCLIGCGTVFKIMPDGQQSVIHAFRGIHRGVTVGEPASPAAGLIADAEGNLYGTTLHGGKVFDGSSPCYDVGCGTVFKMTPDGQLTVLYAFEGGSDGANPADRLVADDDGNFYGTTVEAGDGGGGTAFKLTPEGAVSVLHSFDEGSEPGGGLLVDLQGNLYGVTSGGGANDAGTVFKLTPDGALSVLYDFHSFRGDGETPLGRLIMDRRGNLFGTTDEGGANGLGTIFKVQN